MVGFPDIGKLTESFHVPMHNMIAILEELLKEIKKTNSLLEDIRNK